MSAPPLAFLSYASEDVAVATSVWEELTKRGVSVWFDREELLPGQDWALEIRKAIKQSSAIIVLVSPRSVSKIGYLQKELRAAFDAADERPPGAVFILPLRIDDAEMPERFEALQYIDMTRADWATRLERSLELAGAS